MLCLYGLQALFMSVIRIIAFGVVELEPKILLFFLSLIDFISLSAANYVSLTELGAAVKFIQQQGRDFSISDLALNINKRISL